MESQKENLPEPDKVNDLFEFISECKEKGNKERDINFETFIEELKIEPIDYGLSNNKVQFEVIENRSKADSNVLKKQSKDKAEGKLKRKLEGEIIENDHYYLMKEKFHEGKRLHKLGKYKEAKKLFKESAEGGCAEGMHCLAIVYINGEGAKKSIKKASYWATMAIQYADFRARETLAIILDETEEELGRCFIF